MSEKPRTETDSTNPLNWRGAEDAARESRAHAGASGVSESSLGKSSAGRRAPVFVFGFVGLVAAGAIAGLSIQNRDLRAEVENLRAELRREQAPPTFQSRPGDQATRPKDFKSAGVKIVSAAYGSGDKFSDVTPRVNEVLFRESQFYARPEWLKVDPTPGWNKALVISYEFDHQRFIFSCGEGFRVTADVLLEKARKDRLQPSEWE